MTAPKCPHCKKPCTEFNGLQRLPVVIDGKVMTHVQEFWTCADKPVGCASTTVGEEWNEEPRPGEWDWIFNKQMEVA